jgi:hypothetical protein
MRVVSATLFESTNGLRYERAIDALSDDLSRVGALDGLYSNIRNGALYASPARRGAACDEADKAIDAAFDTLRRYRAIVAQIRELKS